MIVLATTNQGKVEELQMLAPSEFVIRGLEDVSLELDPETGSTFLENALIKARSIARHGYAVIADDSGLEVDALDGRPGILSSRFAGPDASDGDNNRKLLRCLEGMPDGDRTARFRCVVVLIAPDLVELTAEGTIEGRITRQPRGASGFGYDPLFEIHDDRAVTLVGKTMAELQAAQKNRYSHRGRAFRSLLGKVQDRPDVMRQLVDLRHVGHNTNEAQ